MPIPAASRTRSPSRLTSGPAAGAMTSRMSAKALITAPAAVGPTPKWRANSGSSGATSPYPSATKKPTPTRAPTSVGRSPSSERGVLRVNSRRSIPPDDTSAGGGIHGRGLGGRVLGRRLIVDEHEADLAALVDLGDLDLQLVADVHDVLDLADPLAAAQLADVQQAVLARQQGDESAEGRRLHH